MNNLTREKKLAKRIAEKYSLTPPIDVVAVIKNYADYLEKYLPSKADAICIMTKKPLVVVQRIQADTRKRFTVAHELGHIIMPWHHGMISCHTDTEDVIDGTAYQKMESEANSFAAELLMPSAWIKEIIKKNEKYGIEKIIDIVAVKAKVSRRAAFYSIIPQLPSGYIFYLDNGDYISRKYSPGIKIYVPYQEEDEREEWLNKCSSLSNDFELDNIYIKYWKVENKLDIDDIKLHAKNAVQIDLGNTMKEIIKNGNGTFVTVFLELLKYLPPGYVIIITQRNYRQENVSPGTKVTFPAESTNLNEWFSNFFGEWGRLVFLGYGFYWGKITISSPANSSSIDKRHSKELLKVILDECYPDEKEKLIKMRSFNGIIGALNSMEKPNDFNDFYRMFQERLLGRNFDEIIGHQLFESFAINKITEMMTRRKK